MRDMLQVYLAKDLVSFLQAKDIKKAALARMCYLPSGKLWNVVNNHRPPGDPYVYARIYFATGLQSAANLMNHFGLSDELYQKWKDEFEKNPTVYSSKDPKATLSANASKEEVTAKSGPGFDEWIDEVVVQLIKYRDDAGFKTNVLLAEYVGVNESVLRKFLRKQSVPTGREFFLKVFHATNIPAASPANFQGDAYHPGLVPMTQQEYFDWCEKNPRSGNQAPVVKPDELNAQSVSQIQSEVQPEDEHSMMSGESNTDALQTIESVGQSTKTVGQQSWLKKLVVDGVESFFDILTKGVEQQVRSVVQEELVKAEVKHQAPEQNNQIIQLTSVIEDLTKQLLLQNASQSAGLKSAGNDFKESSLENIVTVARGVKVTPKQLAQLVSGLLEILSDLAQRGSIEDRNKASSGLGNLFAQLRPYINAFTYDSSTDRDEALASIRKIAL